MGEEGDGYKPRHLKAAEGLVRSSLSLIWAGWAHLSTIVVIVVIVTFIVIIIFKVISVIMVIIILGNAGLNVVGLDPLTQPLHGTVAVEWIRPQGPDRCVMISFAENMLRFITAVMMDMESRLLMMI